MRAGVVGAPEYAALGLDQREDAIGPAGRDGQADAPGVAAGEAVAHQLFPRAAAVGRLEESAVGAAARERPRHAPKVPHAGVDDVAILWIHRQVARAACGAEVERLLPRGAAVERDVNAAVGRIAKRIAEPTDDDVPRVARVDRDA